MELKLLKDFNINILYMRY